MFDTTSRYYKLGNLTLTVTEADGRQRVIAYKQRRFLPAADTDTSVVDHTVAQGDRLDNITARYLGDPTQFWRIADANHVMRPSELEELARIVRIPMPGV